MSTRTTRLKQIVSKVLVACMLIALLPSNITAHAATITVNSEAELISKYASANSGDTIRLGDDIALTDSLHFDRGISITLDGQGMYRIYPDSSFPTAPYQQPYLLYVTDTQVTFKDITFDGLNTVSGIEIRNNAAKEPANYTAEVEHRYTFDNVKIIKTKKGAGNGSGVAILSREKTQTMQSGFTASNSTYVTISGGTLFDNNYLAPEDSSSFGGALYLQGNVYADIDNAKFTGNTASSGGAISQTYAYIKMSANTTFSGNRAGQRGGAIICNGPLVLDGTKITSNSSDQFGGAIYVAAHSGNHGQVVMKNGAQITGNQSNSAGGGIYIADDAEVYLDEASSSLEVTVKDNTNPTMDPENAPGNNIFVASANAKLYVASKQTTGKIYVSTQNPFKTEDLVWSTTNDCLNVTTNGSAAGLNGALTRMGIATYTPYSIQGNFAAANYALFEYDSEVYSLVKSTTGKDAIMLDYGSNGVIFDFNLPGQPCQYALEKAAGSTVAVPTVTNPVQTIGSTTFTFLGWFTEPTGGTQVTVATVPNSGVAVYYAHWNVTSSGGSGGGGGNPGTGSMRIVYFDQNTGTGSGGLTSAYVLSGNFTITVYDDEGNSEDKTVTLPFAWPEDPRRDGYDFIGWGDTPTSTTPVNRGNTPDNGQTLFGIWQAHTHTLTWNANGGQGGTTTTQKYDELIKPPATAPTRSGYTFGGWYVDSNCSVPLTGDATVTGDQTFYAQWLSERVVVTYYDTREGTSVVGTQDYNYGDVLVPLASMADTSGQTFVRWQTAGGTPATSIGNLTSANLTYHRGSNGSNVSSDDGYWSLDFYAVWAQETTDYVATINWDDLQDNDGCRPQSVKLGLISSVNNRVVATQTVANDGNDSQTYTFTDLPITTADSSVERITYSVFMMGYTDSDGIYHDIDDTSASSGEIYGSTSSNYDNAVFTLYRYAINNYMTGASAAAYSGAIFLDHDLITTGDDLEFTIQWDDESDNDGKRPGAVTLVLYADGLKVSDYPLHNSSNGVVSASASNCTVSEDGNVWTYIFKDYQKYNAGTAINYTVAVTNNNQTTRFNGNGYTTTYLSGTAAASGDPNGAVISRPIELTNKTVTIRWDDESNRDGLRQPNVDVVLSAYQWNNRTFGWEEVMVDTAEITASVSVDTWTYTFTDVKKYNGGQEIIYKANISSDLNAHLPVSSTQFVQ